MYSKQGTGQWSVGGRCMVGEGRVGESGVEVEEKAEPGSWNLNWVRFNLISYAQT